MSNRNFFGTEGHKKLLRGIEILANAVGTTLGPRGRNVAIDRGYAVDVIHDGVGVAKAIDLKDKAENAGVKLLREAAENQVSDFGDGTSVVTVLGEAIVKESYKLISQGTNPMALRKGLEDGAKTLTEQLDRLSKPVNTLEETIHVATISAEDPDLGKMIGETIDKIGNDGVITVDESKSYDTFVEHQDGMQFDKGYIADIFITDPRRNEATVEDAVIWISDEDLNNMPEYLDFINKVVIQNGDKNIFVIAPDITDSALASFIVNKQTGMVNILPVKAPLFGDKQKSFLEDIAILTGGKVISKASGVQYSQLDPKDVLGHAKRVTATKEATTIVGGNGDAKVITERVDALKTALDEEESSFEQEKLKERIAKLTNGVSVIKVGGYTSVEMKERKERAEDSVHATKHAVEGGIVPGGEVTLLNIRDHLDLKDEAGGILYRALGKPFEKLTSNAGLNSELMRSKLTSSTEGIDVTTGEVKDMIESGIVDPTLVVKGAINNAISAAIQILTTDLVIVPEDEPKKG